MLTKLSPLSGLLEGNDMADRVILSPDLVDWESTPSTRSERMHSENPTSVDRVICQPMLTI